MPTYRCLSTTGRLDPEARAKIAEIVTRAHHEVTGAPPYFAQVVFETVEPAAIFIGGAPLEHDHVFIHGFIRDGRSDEQRRTLVERIARETGEALGADPRAVWVYLTELPPHHMVEFGQVLPRSGEEAAWAKSLPKALRSWLERLGS